MVCISKNMESFCPKILIAEKQESSDDMYIVNGHSFNLCRPIILNILDEIINSRRMNSLEDPIQLADYGAADGKTTLSTVNEIIANIRSKCGQKQQVMVFYNDYVINDFNILGRALKGNDKKPGLLYDTNVYVTMIPRSMYEQCVPNDCLDLAFSSLAVYYLSTKVCNIKNGVVFEEADQEEKELIEDKAKSDWRSFVVHRGRELKPGGYLVVLATSTNDDNMVSSHVSGGPKCLGAMVRDMKNSGIISEQEYIETNLNAYYMGREADFRGPFTNVVPEVLELGLEIVTIRKTTWFKPHEIFDIVNKDSKEKKIYAERLVSSIKPWMHYVIYGGLPSTRSEAEKQDIVNNFFERVYKHAYSTCDHKLYHVYSITVIKRST